MHQPHNDGDGVQKPSAVRKRSSGKTGKSRRGWPWISAIPILPGSEENKAGSKCVFDRERSENRQRLKGLGVVGGVAGLNGTGGGNAARVPAVGLLAAGLFPVAASPRSGLDTSVPGTKMWRYRAIAADSSSVRVPRNEGMTAPRPSRMTRVRYESGHVACQVVFVKSGTSGMSQTPRPSMPWHRMQYRLNRLMTTRRSCSGLLIQYHWPAHSSDE